MCPTTYKIPTLLSGPRSHCCLQLHAHVKRPLKLPRPRCEIFCVCVCVSLCVFAFVCHGLWGRMRPEFVAQFDVGMLVRLCCGLCASAVVCVPLPWSVCLCRGLCASAVVCVPLPWSVCLCRGLCASALVCVPLPWSVCLCCGLCASAVVCVPLPLPWSVCLCRGLCASAVVYVPLLWSVCLLCMVSIQLRELHYAEWIRRAVPGIYFSFLYLCKCQRVRFDLGIQWC